LNLSILWRKSPSKSPHHHPTNRFGTNSNNTQTIS